MGFQYVPSLFRVPQIPNYSPPDGIWRGKGQDEGLFAFHTGSWGYVMVADGDFCQSLKVGSSVLKPVFTDVNGYIYWEGSGYVYYTQTYGWVWCDKFPGYEPIENWEFDDEQNSTWTGDGFYTLSGLPCGPDDEVEMQPRGALYEKGETKSLKMTWPRWEAKDGEFGAYAGKDGNAGEKILGLPRYKGNGECFVRSLNRENGYYAYGRIRHAGGKWVIGEIGSPGGWHEGSEPTPDGGSNFKFVKPEGSDAEGSDISVSLDRYTGGDETEAAYLGSAAIWR